MFRPRPEIIREPFTVMATASADAPLKGLDYLLQAIAQLKEELPQLRLNVLGKLKEDGDSRALITKLGLTDHITFHSGLTSDEVSELYARATIAVVPSIYEGFGLPAAEAMACGVPVVSTDGGALPEVVGDCGITVPTRNADKIAEAIRQLFNDKNLRSELAEKGRQRILENFSWDIAARDVVDVYRTVIRESV